MLIGIIFTLLTGLCFLIGIFAFQHSKHREKFSLFTLALACVVIFGLLVFDLLKELIEIGDIKLIIPTIFGFAFLILLDKLIPHHDHKHEEKNDDKQDHNLHLEHIGVVTLLSLTIHNFLEGLTLYNISVNDTLAGALMMIGISFHNIPLGFQIGNSLKERKTNIFLIILLCLSSFLGALVIIIFGSLNVLITNILLAFTFGMLLYILIFELFREIKSYFTKKEVLYGIILGVILLFIVYIL